MEYLKGLLFILIVAEIALSGYLAYTYIYEITPLCLTGFGCKTVQNSEYSHILGIPISVLGFLSFIILLIVYHFVYKEKVNCNWFLALCILGALGALYFLYLQFFVIKAVCSNCLIVDLGMIIILILALIISKKN